MISLIITRDNVMVNQFTYEDESELEIALSDVVSSIFGLDFTPQLWENLDIPAINTVLEFQGYQDRLHKVNLGAENIDEKEVILYKENNTLVVTKDELVNHVNLLSKVIPVTKDILEYFIEMKPDYKRSTMRGLLDILNKNYGMNYIILNNYGGVQI
jgi:hypothetical protein